MSSRCHSAPPPQLEVLQSSFLPPRWPRLQPAQGKWAARLAAAGTAPGTVREGEGGREPGRREDEGGGGWGRRGRVGSRGEAGHQGLNLDTNLNRYCPFPGQDWSEGATTPLMCPNMGWDSRRAPLPPEVSPEPGSFQGFSPSHRPLLLSHVFSRFLALNVRVILSFLLSPLFSISFFCVHPYCFLSFASYLVFLGGRG